MMGDKDDYLTTYRVFFEHFAANVNPEDQLPVHIAGYTITEAELPGEVLYWTTQYLTEKQCPSTLMTPLRRIILDEVRTASKKYPNEFGYKSDESVYIALRLMQAVTARVNNVCLRYLDNSRLDSLPPPPPPSLKEHKTVSSATKNSRRVMEDRHVEIGNLEALFGIETTEPTSFYAVYDGHAGSAAATYCAAHLHQYLVESPHFTSDLKRALRDAFLRTDAEFVRKSNQERASGGSTAVGVATRGRWLHAAWAGDSLALLAKRMRLMQLVRPHKPARQDERDRIESSGGTVMYWGTWRVNGQLAVSRAIGDAQYKPYVTARPEIVSVELDGDEDFVVIACDGLWDFVSEDDVALAVYRQLAVNPDDLKAVTKRLILQAKRQGSSDNISIIVVFLKDPRNIAADNPPPMELGLDNVMVNVPPFTMEADSCKRQLDVAAADDGSECADADADDAAANSAVDNGVNNGVDNGIDNGVDNSDSDSEDLGPETAVDVDDVVPDSRTHDPAPPTPPAHAVETSHVDGALLDNVAESGEESEDEWNYYKGEGEREEHNTGEEPDEQPRSETPCQDNSAWESSSVDMNSSPLNPDAPVFVPGSVAGADVLLAESPRKPLPMDDIELPDVAQFQTEAVVRPAELLDLDNCDQLNGHHNVSLSEAKEQFNGNENCNMESLGFGFSVGLETDKDKDTSIIQDFERIQKDTTDFCNIQVYQAHTESNPFATDNNDELFERLKNKERDPMSMSFYQEKDDDTCERLTQNESNVDLNAVQPLPDSDDEDLQSNGLCENVNEIDKENIYPENNTNLVGTGHGLDQEPNNDINILEDRTEIISNNIINFGQGDNFNDYNVVSNNFSNLDFESGNIQETVLQTDTPESHKLLFEQIPEIPDGKSSELGFSNEDLLEPSESEKDLGITPQDDVSQDIEMDSKLEDPLEIEIQSEIVPHEEHKESVCLEEAENIILEPDQDKDNEIIKECHMQSDIPQASSEQLPISSVPLNDHKHEEAITPEPSHDIQECTVADIHQNSDTEPVLDKVDVQNKNIDSEILGDIKENAAPEIKFEAELLSTEAAVIQDFECASVSPLPTESILPAQSPITIEHAESPTPSPLPPKSPVHTEIELSNSPLPVHSPLPVNIESPIPAELSVPSQSSLAMQSPALSPLPQVGQELRTDSPLPAEVPLPRESPIPSDSSIPAESLELAVLRNSPVPTKSPLPAHSNLPTELSPDFSTPINPTNVLSPHPNEIASHVQSPIPTESNLLAQSPVPTISTVPNDSLPTHSPVPTETTLLARSPLPVESHTPLDSTLQMESVPEATQSLDGMLSEETVLRPETASPTITSPIPNEIESTAIPTAASPIHLDVEDKQEESRLTPERLHEEPVLNGDDAEAQCKESHVESVAGPTPDIVPDERADAARSELVTDIDIGIPESRAQEICVPVTSEIQQEDAVQPGATPPPTPAIEPTAPAISIAPVADTPIAADIAPAAVAAAAAASVAAGAAAAITAAAKKTPSKKSPTTPMSAKSTAKTSATQRTPASIGKKPTTTTLLKTPTTTPKTPSKTLALATKSPTSKPATTAAKTTPKPPTPKAPVTKPATKSTTPVKEAPAVAKTTTATRAPPAPRAAAPKAPVTASKPALKAPAARPATAPATKMAPSRSASSTGTTRPATAARTLTSKAPEKKPLPNGDVKAPLKKVASAPTTKPMARPTPSAARPAPRPSARPSAPSAPSATTAPKTAAPKPAPRTAAPRPALDKQTKDLANKRITAKAAPPRTAATKVPPGKTTVKSVPKKPLASPKKEEAPQTNGAGAGDEVTKPPPSPPAADNALLPDVIA